MIKKKHGHLCCRTLLFFSRFVENLGRQLVRLKLFIPNKIMISIQFPIDQWVGAVEYIVCRGVRPLFNKCPGYDAKQFHGWVPIMLALWGIQYAPGLFSVFWPISTMLRAWRSRFFFWFPVSLLLLVGGLSLESEWQQVFWGLQNSSQYSGWCKQFSSLEGLNFSSDFQFHYYYYWLMVFHWSLRDRKSPQVSRTLLSSLADLSNAIVWTVSACSPISNSSSDLWDFQKPFKARHLQLVSPSPICSIAFLVL